MQHLNYVDFFILAIFGLSMLLGLMRGFLHEVLSLFTWIGASVVSSMFSSKLAAKFGGSVTADPSVLTSSVADASMNLATQSASLMAIGLSFVFLFLGTFILGSLLTRILTSATESGGIGLANRFLGAVFGGLRAFLIATIIIFVVQLTPMALEPVWAGSATVAAFQPLVKMINDVVQPNIVKIKSKAQGLSTVVTDQIKNVGSTLGGAP